MVGEQPEISGENRPHRSASDEKILVDDENYQEASDNCALLKQKASVASIAKQALHDGIRFSPAALDVDQCHQSIEEIEYQDRHEESRVAFAIGVDEFVLRFSHATPAPSPLGRERRCPRRRWALAPIAATASVDRRPGRLRGSRRTDREQASDRHASVAVMDEFLEAGASMHRLLQRIEGQAASK